VKTVKNGKYLQYNFSLKKITLNLKNICFLWKNYFTRVQCFFSTQIGEKIHQSFSRWKISPEIFNKSKISSRFLTSEKFYLIFQLVQSTILAFKFMIRSNLGKVALLFYIQSIIFISERRLRRATYLQHLKALFFITYQHSWYINWIFDNYVKVRRLVWIFFSPMKDSKKNTARVHVPMS